MITTSSIALIVCVAVCTAVTVAIGVGVAGTVTYAVTIGVADLNQLVGNVRNDSVKSLISNSN